MWTQVKRIFRHRCYSGRAARRAIPTQLLQKLASHIARCEASHTGETRVCVEAGLPMKYLCRAGSNSQITHERALAMFAKLRVWDTEHNNGVLIYLLLAERSVEIVADRGLNQHISASTWKHLIDVIGVAFQANDFEGGLTTAVQEVSWLLLQHFALATGQANPNELPDEPLLT